MNPIKNAVFVVALTLAQVALLSPSIHAAGLENLSVKGTNDFDASRLRFLKPRKNDAGDLTGGVVGGSPMNGEGGFLGVEIEAHLAGEGGWSIPVVIGGVSHRTAAKQTSSGKWNEKYMAAGPMVGVRKRLFQVGIGESKGNGTFLEPYLEAGVAPLAMYSDDTANTREDLSAPPENRYKVVDGKSGSNPMTQAVAGVDMHMKEGWTVGAQVRRVAPLFVKDQSAAFFNFSLKKDF